MGKFKIENPDGSVQWVKAIDTAKGTIEFTDSEALAYERSGDYFAKAEGDYIKFNFRKEHPQLEHLKVLTTFEGIYIPQ